MQVAILSHNARAGDAIGNQIAQKVHFFLDRGADVRIFIEDVRQLHPSLQACYERMDGCQQSGPAWHYLESADLVVVEYGHSYRLLELVPHLCRGKPRILFDYHGVTPPHFWNGARREAAERALSSSGLAWCAVATIAHSAFSARELRKSARLPEDRIRVLPLAIDTDRFCPGPAALREELGIGRAPLMLFVGRLAPNKRVPLLIEALHILRGDQPMLHLAIVGDDSDVYQLEADRCLGRAQELGLANRVHLLGQLAEDRLVDAYRSADVFVMPSLHEGFCIPVIEAQACAVPVVAARAAALTETVGDDGLTFTPDDPTDLARQVGRVLSSRSAGPAAPVLETSGKLRVAIVSVRHGSEVVGGAEASLRSIAETLTLSGHKVEVFTTCTRSESNWTNDLPEGTREVDGIRVHRFAIDGHDRACHLATVQAILEAEGRVERRVEEAYLAHSLHSQRLIEALAQRIGEFDAVLAGPYLFGLIHDVAKRFGEKVLLVPCFHDEPFARLQAWTNTYTQAGGLLYHSIEEQDFAQRELGLNHPRGFCLGTWIDTSHFGDAPRGRNMVGSTRPYLLYCGRLSPQKNLPLLFDFARRYETRHPGRFTFAFAGAGDLRIPKESWALDLGFVTRHDLVDLLRGAASLIQLSRFESLSLVVLEALAQETPVLVNKTCAVLKAHADSSGGGSAIGTFEEFADCLDSLWDHPLEWREKGQRGRAYVQQFFGDRPRFGAALVDVVRSLRKPIAEFMIQRGLQRARQYSGANWRERFGAIVENVLHEPKPSQEDSLEVVPRSLTHRFAKGGTTGLVPVKVSNRGTLPALADGPARWQLCARVQAEAGEIPDCRLEITPLPCLLAPGQETPAAMRVTAPGSDGIYGLSLFATRADDPTGQLMSPVEANCRLIVGGETEPASTSSCTGLLDSVQEMLAHASSRGDLPDDYLDVTEGLFARWKRLLKRKLLGNFKHAYVDVLSRQQSAFNRHMVAATRELADCCATLDHARELVDRSSTSVALDELSHQLRELAEKLSECRTAQTVLETRILELEARMAPSPQEP
jgi:glycosyltransferase involved in cell wall biosynthesis